MQRINWSADVKPLSWSVECLPQGMLRADVAGILMEAHSGDSAGATSWREELARPVGENSLRDQLARTVGVTSWREQLARPVGENSWRDQLARRVGATSWRDQLRGKIATKLATTAMTTAGMTKFSNANVRPQRLFPAERA